MNYCPKLRVFPNNFQVFNEQYEMQAKMLVCIAITAGHQQSQTLVRLLGVRELLSLLGAAAGLCLLVSLCFVWSDLLARRVETSTSTPASSTTSTSNTSTTSATALTSSTSSCSTLAQVTAGAYALSSLSLLIRFVAPLIALYKSFVHPYGNTDARVAPDR